MKHCKACGLELVRREGENKRHFELRTTCNHSCANRSRVNRSNGGPKPGIAPTGGLTYDQIAERLGMARQNVQRIERVALEKMREAAEGWR